MRSKSVACFEFVSARGNERWPTLISGGAGYRNQSWINGNNAREFALAVYAIAVVDTNSNSSTNAFSGPDGIALHRFSPLSNGVNADGANPAAGVALVNGVLCGTTLNGGPNGAGTAFI